MGFFLVKRLLTLIITLVATSVIVFAVLEILPGLVAKLRARAGQTLRPAPPEPAAAVM